MRNWLSQWLAPKRPARHLARRFRTTPSLELLEGRDAPAIVVGPEINISKDKGDSQETSIIANPNNPLQMFATSTASQAFGGGSGCWFSGDGGKTWKLSDLSGVLGGGGGGDQQTSWDNFGNLFMVYFAGSSQDTVCAYSTDGGATFKLSLDTGALYDQPEVAAAKGLVAIDYTKGGKREVRMAPVTGLGQIGTWSSAENPNNSFTFGGIDIGPNGQVMLVGQENNGSGAPAKMFVEVDPDGLGPAGFTAVTPPAPMTNVGSFNPITPQPNRTIDAEMNIAWDRSGGAHNNRVYLVWTDEIPDGSSDTDIFISYSDNSGNTWSTKKRLNDDALGNGKSQFFPAIAVDQKSGAVAVSWLDCRNSPDDTKTQVFATVSRDGGVTWDANVQISKGQSDVTRGVGGGFDYGDYDQMTFVNGVFWRTWADDTNSTGDNPDGTNGLDVYTAACQSSLPPVITSLSVDPNPITFGQSATLTGTFTDPDSPNDAFLVIINWGDGSPDTKLSVSPGRRSFTAPHAYLAAGSSITTTVNIFDGDGNKGTGTITVSSNSNPPTAVITGTPTGQVDEGKKVTLGSFVTSDNPFNTFSYSWRVLKNGVDYTQGSNAGLSFIPDDNGVYDVFLTVTASAGGSADADPVEIIARNVPPKASGLTNDGPKAPGQLVHVSLVNPTDAQADVDAGLQYQFDTNGDGIYDTAWGTNPFVDVSFATAGIYTLKAHIRDKDGGISPDYFSDVWISSTGGGNGGIITTRYVVAGSDAQTVVPFGTVPPVSTISVYNTDGSLKFNNLRPLGGTYTAGYRVAVGDVNGDHIDDIIAGPGPGGGSTISVLDGVTGSVMFTLPDVYGPNWKSGVYVASGDFDRDGFADIVVAPGAGQVGPVMAFSGFDHHLLFKISPFGASTKGVTVAVGDVDGDKRPDLIVGNATLGSQVKVYRYTSAGLSGAAYRTFNAMPLQYAGGVFVAAGDLDGDGKAEIIVGSNFSPGLTQDSRVRIYNGANNALLRDFVPFAGNRMGVRVAADDLDGDGKADIIMAPSKPVSTSSPNERIIGLSGLTLTAKFQQDLTDVAFQGGVFVG
jgi:hypothetical protein